MAMKSVCAWLCVLVLRARAHWSSSGGIFHTALQNQHQICNSTCSLCRAHSLPLEMLSDPSVCTGQVGGHVGKND